MSDVERRARTGDADGADRRRDGLLIDRPKKPPASVPQRSSADRSDGARLECPNYPARPGLVYDCCSACNFDPQYQATSIAYRADRRATHAPNNTIYPALLGLDRRGVASRVNLPPFMVRWDLSTHVLV